MKVLFPATLSLLVILSGPKRVAASPVAVLRLGRSEQEWPVQLSSASHIKMTTTHKAYSKHSNSVEHQTAKSLPVAEEVVTAELQAAFEDSYSTSSFTTTRRSSTSHRATHPSSAIALDDAPESVSCESDASVSTSDLTFTTAQRTTLFVTAAIATTVHSASLQPLSPLRPLNDGGRSAIRPFHYSKDTASKALPWVLGLLVPALVGAIIWIVVLYRKRKPSMTIAPNMANPSDISGIAGSLESSSSLEKLSTSPEAVGRAPHNVVLTYSDPYELKAARFPTRNELSEYVFPPTDLAVQREILVSRQLQLVNSSTQGSGTMVLPSRHSRHLTSSHPPKLEINSEPFNSIGSRPVIEPKKRFSPHGDILYSTNGTRKSLEMVEEETDGSLYEEYEQEEDDTTYKIVEIDFIPGPTSEQAPLASSTSYHEFTQSPGGLRTRRKSSPLIPSISPRPAHEVSKPAQSPILGRLRSSSVGRRCNDAAAKIGQIITTAAERIAPSPKTSAAEEDRKFTEFVKGLVKGMNARDKKRALQFGIEEPTVIYSTGGDNSKAEQDASLSGLSILLPPPSFGAKLSDFDSIDSISSDDPIPSSSVLSIGLAL